MLKNYFRVSIRSMRKNLTQSIMNIVGLSIGIACCMLILMHMTTQLRYDRHVEDLERIYRVVLNGSGPYTPARLVSQMRADFPEIATGTRVMGTFEMIIDKGESFVRQEGCMMADSTFFELFPTTFVFGDPITALNRPMTAVLTRSAAERLYPEANPIGQRLVSDGDSYEVTAVVEDPPMTTTLPYQMIVAIPWEAWATKGYWTGNNFYSYLKLKNDADPELLEAKFLQFVERHIGPEFLAFSDQYTSFQEFIDAGNQHFFSLVPLGEVHLHHPRLTLGNPGSFTNMVVFSMIALFILIIACINYVNMATARSSLRSKEIGMRKVLGSYKSMIAQQFLMESFIVTFCSLLIGIVLAMLALPFFNGLSETAYGIGDLVNQRSVVWFLLILLFAALMSGSYPAFYLSSFKPVLALRGEAIRGGNKSVRQGLVIFQFAISIFLIAATLIVFRQVSFMSNRSLGLRADQTFIIQGADQVVDKYEAFKAELLAHPEIQEVGVVNQYPSTFIADWNYRTVGDNPTTISPFNMFASGDIQEIWGLEMVSGRFFDNSRASDTASVVVNEYFVKSLGWEEPIGQELTRGQGSSFRVIGVVKDFVTGSARRGNAPFLFRTQKPEGITSVSGGGYVVARLSGNYVEAITHMENVWGTFVSSYPFDGIFMDDSFDRLYQQERRFGRLFTSFSIIAIIIACVGLFSLATFTLERKRKEIAIRKVMGATVGSVVKMVFRYFLILIGIGGIIALPTVFLLGNTWLEDYVYRIDIGVLHLLLPLLLVIVVALLTVGYQTYRSAVSNPVNSLKEE